MIWYILSPLRGTTQPPRLPANHPVRRAFYRHGKTTTQHWLVVMLISVAIAAGASYPTVLLSESPNSGFAGYPHHVWTTAKPMGESETRPDIEMRQIWIHGSYMHALDKFVLRQGLVIQRSVVGDEQRTAGPWDSDGNSQSRLGHLGFHSPLMYWNNSQQSIDADLDLLQTVNDQRGTTPSLQVIPQPGSLFAGKQFHGRRLVAADALIITLMKRLDANDVGGTWQNSLHAQTQEACKDCSLFPEDGHVTRYKFFEFSFQPLSVQENLALALAYSAMALYVLLSLRRMKAFHSRFGLVVTAITQMTCSILASFTICGVLKINLSTIPQNAYPFVVLVLGVENMFRLINAVVAYPPTMATEMRIANALGDVGPLSVAAAAQNLTILALLSTVVSPGVAAFCAFAAIATLFDAFYLLTFFVAVLNVDIRRLELQDALTARHSQSSRHRRRRSSSTHTWFDALLQGRLPFSTRMAGTAVTTTFILSLNYHFFEQRASSTSLRDLFGLIRSGPPSLGDLNTFAPPPMNASLAPGEWMRMQDFDTAKEVMRLARPGGDSFTVRVYAPLVVVLADSDRTGVSSVREAWTSALRSLALHHFYPVAVAVVFAVAFVAVLMNFLLYNEAGDEENERDLEDLDNTLVTLPVSLPHRLDVVKIASNGNGHFITAALDRTIAVAVEDRARQSYHARPLPADICSRIQWPVHDLALDDSGDWVSCHGADGRVAVHNYSTGTFEPDLLRYPDDHPAVIFTFVQLRRPTGSKPHLMVVTSAGRLALSPVDGDITATYADLTVVPIIGAKVLGTTNEGMLLHLVTEDGRIVSFSWDVSMLAWSQVNAQKLNSATSLGGPEGPAHIDAYPDFETDCVLVKTSTSITVLSGTTLSPVGKLDLREATAAGDTILVSSGGRCPYCDGVTLHKLAASGEEHGGIGYTLTTWSAGDDEDSGICLTQGSTACRPFSSAIMAKHEMTNSGAWIASTPDVILGLRRRTQPDVGKQKSTTPVSGVRRRRQHAQNEDDQNCWEAYKLSIDGDLETLDAPGGGIEHRELSEDPAALYVHDAGPVVSLGGQAIAVAFGNVVQVIRASRRGSMSRRPVGIGLERQSSTSRKHVAARRGR